LPIEQTIISQNQKLGDIMGRGRQLIAMAMLIGLGYLLGNLNVLRIPIAFAQDETGPSEDATKKIQAAYDALRGAMDTLKQEGFYQSATKGLNSYAVLAGGVDALKDLEEGKGVDPETFAALYAGDAVESVAEHLSRDEDGRLTYKNKVVRIYPISRLKKMYERRAIMTGEVAPSEKKKK
jgi:hypothetical protein